MHCSYSVPVLGHCERASCGHEGSSGVGSHSREVLVRSFRRCIGRACRHGHGDREPHAHDGVDTQWTRIGDPCRRRPCTYMA